MGRRTIPMTEQIEILYQHHQGVSARQIAKSLNISRNTIKDLLNRAKAYGYHRETTHTKDLVEIIRKIHESKDKSVLAETKSAQHVLSEVHEQIKEYLQKPYMTVRQCFRLLEEQYQVGCSETSLHRYIKKHFPTLKDAVIPLPTMPGKQAQVDYGYVGLMHCPETGKDKKAYAFIMTLSHSRYRFVRFVFKQDTQTWVDCHRRAFEFFGGVPQVVVLDNLKAGIIKPDIYDPTLNKTYAECEKHYGFVADPAKVRVPQHKGKVERSVTIVKQQVIAGRQFADIQSANDYALHWCREIIANVITRTTGETPKARFECDEQPALQALPDIPFDPPLWQCALVQPDSHITFHGSFYSIPPGYLGQTLWVRADSRLVRCYTSEHQLIKSHPRVTTKGTWCTDWHDIPKNRRDYVLQTPEQLISLASLVGKQCQQLVSQLIDNVLTETKKRKVNALLKLAENYSPMQLEAACARALLFENPTLKAITRILEKGLESHDPPESTAIDNPAEGAFLHEPTDFYYQ